MVLAAVAPHSLHVACPAASPGGRIWQRQASLAVTTTNFCPISPFPCPNNPALFNQFLSCPLNTVLSNQPHSLTNQPSSVSQREGVGSVNEHSLRRISSGLGIDWLKRVKKRSGFRLRLMSSDCEALSKYLIYNCANGWESPDSSSRRLQEARFHFWKQVLTRNPIVQLFNFTIVSTGWEPLESSSRKVQEAELSSWKQVRI